MVNLELRAIELKNIQVGIHIQRSRHIRILENKIIGNYSHFAEKGNGIAVFKSEDVAIEHNTIKQVQDGIYVEEVKRVDVNDVSVFQERRPSLVVVLYQEDALQRWVIVCGR